MLKLKVIGTIFGQTGYDSHTRQLINELDKIDGIEISLECNKPYDWVRRVSDRELSMIKRNDNNDYDAILIISLPTTTQLYLCENVPIIQFCVWEGSHIPKGWLHILNDERVRQIWTPSTHVLNAIKNTTNDKDILDKVRIVPHGVDSKLFYPIIKDKKNKPFSFFVNKGWRNNEDRGGTQYAVKAFLEEFNEGEDVQLLIKINPSYGIPNVNKLIDELKPKNKTNFAKINVNADNLNYKDMNLLYNEGDVFLAPTRCEGFHLGCIEAMSCGLSVITTIFGGQTDFCNGKNGWIIDGKLTEIDFDTQYEGIFWLTPKLDELKLAMREAYNDWKYNNSSTLAIKSRESLDTAIKYSWKNSAKIAYNSLKEII